MKLFARIAAVCAFSAVLAAFAARSEAPLPAVPAPDVAPSDVESASTARILSYHLMPLRSRGPLTGGGRTKEYDIPPIWGGYTFGGAFNVKYHAFTKLFYKNDLLAVLHAALVRNGKQAGYSNMYHIFLPKGTDTCFDRTRSCYSPNHPPTDRFCAYHESVKFDDVPETVIASVEPYQKEGFCASRASSGASALTNSTASTRAHEMFESITDPGPAFAWFNFTFDSEVADLCDVSMEDLSRRHRL